MNVASFLHPFALSVARAASEVEVSEVEVSAAPSTSALQAYAQGERIFEIDVDNSSAAGCTVAHIVQF
jgi:hypothetical protein